MRNEPNIIYFITGNENKFKEVFKIFHDENLNYELRQKDIETVEIQANSIKEVALFKLNSVKDKIKGSYFIEDAGFFVDQPLNGFPGVYSSYVMKTIGNEGILNLINDYKNAKAHFSAVIALYYEPSDETVTFEGHVKGRVSETMRGEHGFGFDPIFIPDKNPTSTFAELPMSEKNKLSHRSEALNKLIDFLKDNLQIK